MDIDFWLISMGDAVMRLGRDESGHLRNLTNPPVL